MSIQCCHVYVKSADFYILPFNLNDFCLTQFVKQIEKCIGQANGLYIFQFFTVYKKYLNKHADL